MCTDISQYARKNQYVQFLNENITQHIFLDDNFGFLYVFGSNLAEQWENEKQQLINIGLLDIFYSPLLIHPLNVSVVPQKSSYPHRDRSLQWLPLYSLPQCPSLFCIPVSQSTLCPSVPVCCASDGVSHWSPSSVPGIWVPRDTQSPGSLPVLTQCQCQSLSLCASLASMVILTQCVQVSQCPSVPISVTSLYQICRLQVLYDYMYLLFSVNTNLTLIANVSVYCSPTLVTKRKCPSIYCLIMYVALGSVTTPVSSSVPAPGTLQPPGSLAPLALVSNVSLDTSVQDIHIWFYNAVTSHPFIFLLFGSLLDWALLSTFEHFRN